MMKLFQLSALIVALSLFFVAPVSAQARIATIDLRKIFEDYWKKKQADNIIKERIDELEKGRKALLERYQKMSEEYRDAMDQANSQAVGADEREKRKKTAEGKLRDLKELEAQISQYNDTARANMDEQQRRIRDNILDEIRKVVEARAKAGNFSLVLDSDKLNKTPVVVFTNGDNDLTEAVLKELNANAPAGVLNPAPPPAPPPGSLFAPAPGPKKDDKK
jgi:Skp family chaperone for outer membrane proteins